MDDFISNLSNSICTYLNEHGLYTVTYNGLRLPNSHSIKLLDIYLFDPFNFLGNLENSYLGHCTLSIKDDNLILDHRLGRAYQMGSYEKDFINFNLHNEDLLQLVLNSAKDELYNVYIKLIQSRNPRS